MPNYDITFLICADTRYATTFNQTWRPSAIRRLRARSFVPFPKDIEQYLRWPKQENNLIGQMKSTRFGFGFAMNSKGSVICDSEEEHPLLFLVGTSPDDELIREATLLDQVFLEGLSADDLDILEQAAKDAYDGAPLTLRNFRIVLYSRIMASSSEPKPNISNQITTNANELVDLIERLPYPPDLRSSKALRDALAYASLLDFLDTSLEEGFKHCRPPLSAGKDGPKDFIPYAPADGEPFIVTREEIDMRLGQIENGVAFLPRVAAIIATSRSPTISDLSADSITGSDPTTRRLVKQMKTLGLIIESPAPQASSTLLARTPFFDACVSHRADWLRAIQLRTFEWKMGKSPEDVLAFLHDLGARILLHPDERLFGDT